MLQLGSVLRVLHKQSFGGDGALVPQVGWDVGSEGQNLDTDMDQ